MATPSKSLDNIVEIVRNVTGRVDASDPLFSNAVMGQRVIDFLQLEASADIRIFNYTSWYEFNIDELSADPLPIDMDAIGYTTLEPPCYIDGHKTLWFQNPQDFYWIWPETQTYDANRPTHVLWYNNELTFRAPPDQEYGVKIKAYRIDIEFDEFNTLKPAHIYRYIAYGTALNIFSDFGEMDRYAEIEPIFRKYKATVNARQWQQLQNQTTERSW